MGRRGEGEGRRQRGGKAEMSKSHSNSPGWPSLSLCAIAAPNDVQVTA
jgi:hypothetical protein